MFFLREQSAICHRCNYKKYIKLLHKQTNLYILLAYSLLARKGTKNI